MKKRPYSPPTSASVYSDVLAEAISLGIPSGFAETIARAATSRLMDFYRSHPVVTQADVDGILCDTLSQYSLDLAYIYINRDKII